MAANLQLGHQPAPVTAFSNAAGFDQLRLTFAALRNGCMDCTHLLAAGTACALSLFLDGKPEMLCQACWDIRMLSKVAHELQ